jgi:hypothetical protein
VTADWSGTQFRARFVFDGEISEHDAEAMQVVTTEVVADFEEPWTISDELLRVDSPSDLRVLHLAEVAYQRKEPRA